MHKLYKHEIYLIKLYKKVHYTIDVLTMKNIFVQNIVQQKFRAFTIKVILTKTRSQI